MANWNIRSGDGAGAGMGFRGGAGKPGYPVPDVLQHEVEPTETGMAVEQVVEDIISKIAVTGIIPSEEPVAIVKAKPLDLVVWDTVSGLLSNKQEEDLGFGFNEDGYQIQDKYVLQGMPISVENKKGSVRKWYDDDGKEKGSTDMYCDYGYIEGSKGFDGDAIDVYVGEEEDAPYVYVVHQNKAPEFKEYDEDKVMLGFESEEAAREAYKRQYNDTRFYGGMSSMPIEKFKKKAMLNAGKKITNEARIAAPRPVQKSIDHIEDLKPDAFMSFISALKNSQLEISEKLDGSARVTFGVKDGKVWTQSKNGQVKASAEDYPDSHMYSALKAAHKGLSSRERELSAAWPSDIHSMVAEVLFTSVPNSIEYGPNAIVIHGVNAVDDRDLSSDECALVANALTKSVGGKLDDGKNTWKFDYKPIVDSSKFKVELDEDGLKQLYTQLKSLEANRKKMTGKSAYKECSEKFQKQQMEVKKKLLGNLRKHQSAYGPKGGDVEGLVFRDKSGNMTKLVDKEYFTKLNKFLWHFREMLDKGIKEGETWKPGVSQSLRNSMAESVLSHPAAKSPAFLKKLQDFAKTAKVKDGKDPVSQILAQYVKANGLMPNKDYISKATAALKKARTSYGSVKKEWLQKRNEDIAFEFKDDSGKTIRRVKMHPLVKSRTDESFITTENSLKAFEESLKKISKMKGELTKKTAILKLTLGPTKLDKLKESLNEDPAKRPISAGEIPEFLKSFAEKLHKRGISVPNNISHLGSGTQAAVIDIGHEKVLKITNDLRDAKACIKLKNVNLKHIAKVHDVFSFPVEPVRYGIVMDKLFPIPGTGEKPTNMSGEAKELQTAIWDSNMRAVMDDRDPDAKSWRNLLKEMEEQLKKDIAAHPGTKEVAWEKFSDSINVLKKYQIPDMVDELGSHGINFSDYHPGNIMKKKDGNYALVDLGYSNVQGGGAIPVLEKKLQEKVSNLAMYKQVISRHGDQLAKRGIKLGSQLGEGANALVYDVGGGKVLKVTIDEDDAKASNHIKGKSIKHVAKIFDVFKFKTDPNEEGDFYGIVAEKLSPLPSSESDEIEESLNNLEVLTSSVNVDWIGPHIEKDLKRAEDKLKDPEEKKELQKAIAVLTKYKVIDVMKDLYSHDISWYDMHHGNLMKRGQDIVAVDLGTSDSPGKEPPTLEKKMVESVMVSLREARADRVGVTIGRFQPFHKGHAAIIRDLTKTYNKVILIIAGNTKDKKNPFSYDLRVDMIKKSLPDVISKVEIHKAVYDGKNSGYIPGVLSDISRDTDSTISGDTAVEILVGQDRFSEIQKQIEHAKKAKEEGTELNFDPVLAVVKSLPDVKNDDEAERISGTRVREAVASDNEETVKKMMDDHLISNPSDFRDVYAKMKSELGVTPKKDEIKEIIEAVVDEEIRDIGGEDGVYKIIHANLDRLKNSKWHLTNFKKLGGGQEGIAFDVGGGKVLKVTADEREAITSNMLIGKTNLKNVVHIFDVFSFPDLSGATLIKPAKGGSNEPTRKAGTQAPPGAERYPAYGILTEKLTPLSSAERDEFDSKIDDLDVLMKSVGGFFSHIRRLKWDELIGRMEKAFTEDIEKEGLKPDNPRFKRVFDQRIKVYTDLFQKFKIKEMHDELMSVGIQFSDYHGGNIMKRGSEYVINDLGRSNAPSTSLPKKLGEIVEEMIIKEFGMNGIGGSMVGQSAGSSAVSSFKNRVDPNSKELWQNQLSRLEIFGSGSLPE